MMSKATYLVLTAILSTALVVLPAAACERAGPSTHVGEVTAINLGQNSLTITDQQMNSPVTFLAAPEQLKGLSLGQTVIVKYSETGGQLKAEEIKPL